MEIISVHGNEDIAKVYVAKDEKDNYLEFVESVQPPIPLNKKWVLIISTLYGCPVKCKFCDAGYQYKGIVSYEDLLFQIKTMVLKRFPDYKVNVEKFKIQFARMGEPSYNNNVLKLLQELPNILNTKGLMPSFSTIAPKGRDDFFEKLSYIKNTIYKSNFQMQFSIHTTNEEERNNLIPVEKWSFSKIASYCDDFYKIGDRKITLNFALSNGNQIDENVLKKYFDPEMFIIKITPVNPTYSSYENKIDSYFKDFRQDELLDKLKTLGYDAILSIGELEENQIGSNCGQFIRTHLNSTIKLENAYLKVNNR